jgi:succinoglycan biosynthesis transport protein ExoP
MKPYVTVSEILEIVRRRKQFFIIPFLIISLISVIGAYVLPKRYEAYTTILIQKEKTLNPLLDWGRAVAFAMADNQLASFNEIVLSRTTIQTLLDSLGIKPEKGEKIDDLIESTRKKIWTDLRGNDSFRITFVDSDPYLCQRAATVLCNIYIHKSLQSDRQQAEETVRFLEQKVEELRLQYEAQQQEYLETRQRGLASAPITETGLQGMLGRIQEQLTDKERELEQQQRALSQLKLFQNNLDNPGVVSQIAALDPQGGTILYVDTLKAVSLRYNQMLSRYKPTYPAVQSLRRELADLLGKSIDALEARVEQTKAERTSLVNLREKTQHEISSSINVGIVGGARGSEYIRVKENYDGAKQKLDQARIAKELTERGASRYVILDPAEVPTTPTKPKKPVIIGGGMVLGIIVGLAAMFLMEYYDPTIRRKQDIEMFHKPIIGYLP